MIRLRDPESASELRTFIYNQKSGKAEAAQGSNDDYAMAVMIACRVDEDTKSGQINASQGADLSSVPPGTMEHMFLKDLFTSARKRQRSVAQDLVACGHYPEVTEEW